MLTNEYLSSFVNHNLFFADKSLNSHGKTLSRILKGGGGSKMNFSEMEKESSCENRPILHPVSMDNEFAPTPSVLDVLKEISRKRINNSVIILFSKILESLKSNTLISLILFFSYSIYFFCRIQ